MRVGLTIIWAFLSGAACAQVGAPPVSPAPISRLEYDAEGHVTRRVDAAGTLNLSTTQAYDRLRRRISITDARGSPTQLGYDGLDGLVLVVDPRGLQTATPRNGLGDVRSLQSPDTGTATMTYDAAGRLLTRQDSRGVLATHQYDALGRPRMISFSAAGQAPQVHAWNYDETGPGFSHGVGRLTSTQFPGGSATYAYDAHGRVTTTTQTVAATASAVSLATGYGYDEAGRVVRIHYPSGRVLTITRVEGVPTGVSLASSAGSAPVPLISGLTFEPVPGGQGPARSWLWHLAAGTLPHERVYDVYGRMVRHPLGGAIRDISYDAADRISAYTHRSAAGGHVVASLDQSFAYDEASRLTAVNTSVGNWTFAYDDNGNRILLTQSGGAGVVHRTHTIDSGSNRLLAIDSPARIFGHDAMGNVTMSNESGRGWTATHDLSGRIQSITATPPATGATPVSGTYLYNVMGQRVGRTWVGPQGVGATPPPTEPGPCPESSTAGSLSCSPAPPLESLAAGGGGAHSSSAAGGAAAVSLPPTSATGSSAQAAVYVYAQSGELLGEYDGYTGAVRREYVWLDDMPVAVVDSSPAAPEIYFVQADHLNTPRVLLDRAGRQRWSWVGEPFGHSAPIEDPIGIGPVKLNLRMPGQYFDEESGLNYNWHRSYDSGAGRYTQSDPIGLAGGVNTYAYVFNQPTMLIDPSGLDPWWRENPDPWYPGKVPPFHCRPDGNQWGWGCGTKDSDHYVPDVVGGVNLTPACRKHDQCYDSNAPRPGASRLACDVQFKRDIYDLCRQAGRGNAYCRLISRSYFEGVDRGGADAWNRARTSRP